MSDCDDGGQDSYYGDNNYGSHSYYDNSHQNYYESQLHHGFGQDNNDDHHSNYHHGSHGHSHSHSHQDHSHCHSHGHSHSHSHEHSHASHNHDSSTKESDSSKVPESRNVDFNLPSSSDDRDDTKDLIDIQKDDDSSDAQETTPRHELGNYENSIIDHFVSSQKDPGATQSINRNEGFNTNQNQEKDDLDCCSCKAGPLMCLAIFCDCFGL